MVNGDSDPVPSAFHILRTVLGSAPYLQASRVLVGQATRFACQAPRPRDKGRTASLFRR